ncbi:MAG: hypothetical protein ACPGTQ_11955 [Colwellia sp.]
MKSISGLLIATLAVGIGLSTLLGAKSMPFWLFVIVLILFSGSKSKK